MNCDEVQARANYQQRGYKKVLDTFLSNYWKGLIGSEMCVDGLLYDLDIVIVSQQMQVGLDSSRQTIPQPNDKLISICIFHGVVFIQIHNGYVKISLNVLML
jgi:hypothetical protein